MTLYLPLTGINPDSRRKATYTADGESIVKVILEHGDDINDDLHYRHHLTKLEVRGLKLITIITTALDLYRNAMSEALYKDRLELNISMLCFNINKAISSNNNNPQLATYLASIGQNTRVGAKIQYDDVKFMLEYYYRFFRNVDMNKWITPINVVLHANMLIVEGWYEVY